MPALAQRGLTLLLVVLGWVIFRAPDLGVAADVYSAMFGLRAVDLGWFVQPFTLMLLAALAFTLVAKPSVERPLRPTLARAVGCGLLLAAAILWMNRESPFLYYQF
jgi:alginate O-acetyltransferase complex protein AlgI